MKTIEEQKQQSFDNFAVLCAIASESIEDKKIPFESGWDAAIEFAQRWIPVEEELPENDDEVLTKTSDEWYRVIVFINRFPSQVTHWRPIKLKL